MFLKKIILLLSWVFVFVPGLALAADPPASTTPDNSATSDFGLTTSAEAAHLPKGEVDLMSVVANVIGTALSLIGVIFMILFIYGGFMWMTAGGDSGKTKKAKELMTNAVVGVVLIFSAYFITNFVINELVSSTTSQSDTGASTTTDNGTTTGGSSV